MASEFRNLGRRALLKGAGVTISLPWLESVRVRASDDAPPAAKTDQPPVRFACLFSGNGFHSREWWAKGEGDAMQLGKVLEPHWVGWMLIATLVALVLSRFIFHRALASYRSASS